MKRSCGTLAASRSPLPLPTLPTLYLTRENLSPGFSPLICPPHSSRGTECSLKPSTFHYTATRHNLNLFSDKYNSEEYFAVRGLREYSVNSSPVAKFLPFSRVAGNEEIRCNFSGQIFEIPAIRFARSRNLRYVRDTGDPVKCSHSLRTSLRGFHFSQVRDW